MTSAPPPLSPALRIRFGSAPGFSLRVCALDLQIQSTQKEGYTRIVTAIVPSFTRLAVAYSYRDNDGKHNKCMILVPSEDQATFQLGPLGLEGRFRIQKELTNPARAADVFRHFNPA